MNEPAPVDFLIVDDDENFSYVLARALGKRGLAVITASSVDDAIERARHQPIDKAVVDLKMEGPSGLTLIPALKQMQPRIQIVILTGYSSIATAVEATKLGAVNYLCKPANTREILEAFDSEQARPEVPIADNPPSVDRLEWEHIQKVLRENNDNISATARALGMHRRTLQRKLQKYPARR